MNRFYKNCLIAILAMFCWSFFIRMQVFNAGWTNSAVVSVIFSAAISFFESLGLFAVILFVFRIFAKLPPLAIFLGIVIGFVNYLWWLSNLLELRFLGFIRRSSFQSLKMLTARHDLISPDFSTSLSGSEIVFLGLSLFVFVYFAYLVGRQVSKFPRFFQKKLFALLVVFCFLIIPIFDGLRRSHFNLNPRVILNNSLGRISWQEVIRANPFPMPSLYQLVKELQQPTCAMEEFLSSIQIEKKILYVNLQLESINRPLIDTKFQDGSYVMPYFRGLLEESGFNKLSYGMHAPGATVHAEFSALCGMEPLRGTDPFAIYKQLNQSCLPRVFQRAGAVTIAAHGNELSFYNRGEAYPKLGFTNFVSLPDMVKAHLPMGKLGPLDFEAFELSAQEAFSYNKPSFLHFITLQTHFPFVPLQAHAEKIDVSTYPFISNDPNLIKNWFFSSREFDGSLKKIFDYLTNASRSNDYDIVLAAYGDHGPPAPLLFEESASKLQTTKTDLHLRHEEVPYLALIFSKGKMSVLPFPREVSPPFAIADLPYLLSMQLKGIDSFSNIQTILRDFSKNRASYATIPFALRGERAFEVNNGQLEYLDTIPELANSEIVRTVNAFQCEKEKGLIN